MNDWTVDPAELPEDGERYDMTLDKIGVQKIGPKGGKREVIVVKTVIDVGEYEGKRVSKVFDPSDMGFEDKWDTFAYFLGGAKGDPTAHTLKEFLKPIKDNFEKEARFSAVVHLREFEDDSKRGVKYNLTNFGLPEHDEADLHLRSEPTQFKRNT